MDIEQNSRFIDDWYRQKNGDYLLESLKSKVEPILATAFGYHALQLGLGSQQSFLNMSPINHRIYLDRQPCANVGVIANTAELPLESDSIDLLIAHHSLEFGPSPHAVLREIHRVLAPQGQLLVIGFNPYSLLGLGCLIRKAVGSQLWRQQQPVSRQRMTDWLHLLGCEVRSCDYVYGVPPMGTGAMYKTLGKVDHWVNQHRMPLGGVYVLHAIKQVHGVNRPRMRLRERGERLMGLAVPKPAAAPSPSPAIPAKSSYFSQNGDVAA